MSQSSIVLTLPVNEHEYKSSIVASHPFLASLGNTNQNLMRLRHRIVVVCMGQIEVSNQTKNCIIYLGPYIRMIELSQYKIAELN